ncbi:MAG: FAD:protein FMN transferase [Lentisphaeria bacterium]|nr:FAD:protein FMN transferase [Lentisphaeria bacterium]NQZ70690.1 FAD:protein FMN transferase [Lentisphaeria bacterium]
MQRAHPVKHFLFWILMTALVAGGYYRRNALSKTAKNARMWHYKANAKVMATFAEVTFWEKDPDYKKGKAGHELNTKAKVIVWTVFDNVNTRFSNYNKDSEISKLNASAFDAPFKCSDEMWELLMASKVAFEDSHGAFDVTAGPMIKLWGLYRFEIKTLPTEDAINQAREKCGFKKLKFDNENKTVKFSVAGMSIDFGGIAKGYAVDKAVKKLREIGIEKGIVNLGGNIYCFENTPGDRDHYKVAIKHPRAEGAIGYIPFKGKAVATSGDYERFVEIDGNRYTHIINPMSGKPVSEICSVTVLSKSALLADVLSTAIFINQGKHCDELLKKYPDLQIMLISEGVNDTMKQAIKTSSLLKNQTITQRGSNGLVAYKIGKSWHRIHDIKKW